MHAEEACSPETTPANVVLTQVLELRRFHNQFINLIDDVKLFVILEVSSCELLLHAVQYFNSSGILTLGLLRTISCIAVRSGRAVRAGP